MNQINHETSPGAILDLSNATIQLYPGLRARAQKAAQVLVEEVEKRTRLRWPILQELSSVAGVVIRLNQAQPAPTLPTDGFQLITASEGATTQIQILGNDERALLFGVGYLLRQLHMGKGSVILAEALNLTSAPHYALRGHQLGYRDKTNAYDGWDLPQWDQYIRELAIFGTNAIELIPPRSDDRLESVHFPLPPLEMMEGMSRIADDYGLNVWIWYPALDDDYARPEMAV